MVATRSVPPARTRPPSDKASIASFNSRGARNQLPRSRSSNTSSFSVVVELAEHRLGVRKPVEPGVERDQVVLALPCQGPQVEQRHPGSRHRGVIAPVDERHLVVSDEMPASTAVPVSELNPESVLRVRLEQVALLQ